MLQEWSKTNKKQQKKIEPFYCCTIYAQYIKPKYTTAEQCGLQQNIKVRFGPLSHMDSWSGTVLTWDFSLHLSQPHRCLFSWYLTACAHDWIGAAFGTLHRQIKYSTGHSPSPLNQLHASWISFNYITYMEMWYTLHLHMLSNTLSLPKNKRATKKPQCYFWQWDTN